MTEYKIVPIVATDDMISDCRTASAVSGIWHSNQSADDYQQSMYQEALSAAPTDHGLVIVKEADLKALVAALGYAMARQTKGDRLKIKEMLKNAITIKPFGGDNE